MSKNFQKFSLLISVIFLIVLILDYCDCFHYWKCYYLPVYGTDSDYLALPRHSQKVVIFFRGWTQPFFNSILNQTIRADEIICFDKEITLSHNYNRLVRKRKTHGKDMIDCVKRTETEKNTILIELDSNVIYPRNYLETRIKNKEYILTA